MQVVDCVICSYKSRLSYKNVQFSFSQIDLLISKLKWMYDKIFHM